MDYNPSRIGVKELGGGKYTSTSARRRMRYVPAGFIAGVCGVCDNLGIESCKTGAGVPGKGAEQT